MRPPTISFGQTAPAAAGRGSAARHPARALLGAGILAGRAAALLLGVLASAIPTAAEVWTLGRALDAARQGEPGVLAARAAGEAGRADGARSVGALSPRLSLRGGLLRTDDPAMIFTEKLQRGRFAAQDFALDKLNYPAAASALSWGFVGELPLWNGGREWTGPAHGGHLRSAATAGERARVADRLLHAVEAYVDAAGARRAARADSIALAAAVENARAAAARYRMGQVSELDSLRAAARLAEARTSLLERRKDAAVALARLSRIVGASVAEGDIGEGDLAQGDLAEADLANLGLADPAYPAPQAPPQPATASPPAHPDAQAARERAAAVEIDARRAALRLLPSLNVRAALDYYYDPGTGATEHRWAVGVAVELPIWDGTARIQDARAARARARQARAEADLLKNELATRAEAARLDAEISLERRHAARAGREAAEAALSLAQRRYQAGLLPWSDLVSAEAEAARARRQDIDAEVGVVLAHYRHLHAIGELR